MPVAIKTKYEFPKFKFESRTLAIVIFKWNNRKTKMHLPFEAGGVLLAAF